MPYYRNTTYINGPAGGATEQWDYFDSRTNLKTVHDAQKPIYDLRAAMLASGYVLVKYTTTQIADNDGLPVQRAVLQTRETKGAGPSALAPANKDTSANQIWYGLNYLPRRRNKIFGIPNIIISGEDYVPGSSFDAKYQAWAGQVLLREVGWWSADWQPPVQVAGYSVTDTGDVTVFLASNFGDPPGPTAKFRVQLSGVNGKSEINGDRVGTNLRVSAAPGATHQFDLLGKFGLIPWTQGGTAKLYDGVWVPVGVNVPAGPQTGVSGDSVAIEGIGKRQRGAPFGSGRGRAPTRIRT